MNSTQGDAVPLLPHGAPQRRRTFLTRLAGAGAAAFAMLTRRPDEIGAQDAAASSDSGAFNRIQSLLKGGDAATWVFTGDSITHGALHTHGWRSYPEHFAERVRWELQRRRDVVINTGISGDRIVSLLPDLDWRVLRFQPAVVSLMYGMNDCSAGPAGRDRFRDDLATLVERIRACGAVPLLNTPNTVYIANAGGREDLPAYAQIVREFAAEANVPLVDHWQHWQTAKPDQEQLLAWLEDRSIHPGVYGHREFARLIFRTLDIYDDASPTCRLEVP